MINYAHIMLEVAIPISVFIGCNNVYTFGWDGLKYENNRILYDYNPYLSIESIDKKKFNDYPEKATEYPYIKQISELYEKNKIYLYKCNRESYIDLKYKKIIPENFENLDSMEDMSKVLNDIKYLKEIDIDKEITNYKNDYENSVNIFFQDLNKNSTSLTNEFLVMNNTIMEHEKNKLYEEFIEKKYNLLYKVESINRNIDKFKNETFQINHFLVNLNKFIDNIVFTNRKLNETFSNVKSIVVCGNGPYGYEKNISNQIINSCDIVVRMNEFKLVGGLTGAKSSIHFLSSSLCSYTIDENLDYMISINNMHKLKNKYEKLKSKNLIICNTIVIEELLKKYFKLDDSENLKITGLISIIYFYLICKKYNIKDLYIFGINNHALNKEGKQIYVDKIRDIPSKTLHESHNFFIQELIINQLIDKNTMKVHTKYLE